MCFKIVSMALMIVVVLLLSRHIYSIVIEFRSGQTRQAVLFLELYGTQLILLFYSGYSIATRSTKSRFKCSREFDNLQFNRGWSSVFSGTNDDFEAALESALYKAKCGVTEPLMNLISDDGPSLQEVLRICAPADPDEDSDDGSDTYSNLSTDRAGYARVASGNDA